MPDRVIRDELLESERWLWLPTDTHRLVYQSLLLYVDDYANCEGGRRLYRWIQRFTQIKNEVDSIKLMSDLQDADMALRYEVEKKEYWHLTRFKNARLYWTRRCPASPYSGDKDNLQKQRPTKKRYIRDLNALETRLEGVGVGVKGFGSSYTPKRGNGGQNLLRENLQTEGKTQEEIEQEKQRLRKAYKEKDIEII